MLRVPSKILIALCLALLIGCAERHSGADTAEDTAPPAEDGPTTDRRPQAQYFGAGAAAL